MVSQYENGFVSCFFPKRVIDAFPVSSSHHRCPRRHYSPLSVPPPRSCLCSCSPSLSSLSLLAAYLEASDGNDNPTNLPGSSSKESKTRTRRLSSLDAPASLLYIFHTRSILFNSRTMVNTYIQSYFTTLIHYDHITDFSQ